MDRELEPATGVRFGEFEVNFRARELRRQGLKVKINERPFQVLSILVQHAGQVVRREEFQQTVWPTATNVDFDANLNTAITTLRRALNDSFGNPVFIKTIPRQGYRFMAPVAPIGDADSGSPPIAGLSVTAPSNQANKSTVGRPRGTSTQRFAAVLSLLLTIAGAAGWHVYAQRSSRSAETTTPSRRIVILVVPFENLSAGSTQEGLSDGIVYEIITRLEQDSPERLHAIAPSSAMRYKGAKTSIDQVAREENVSYILQGAYQCHEGRVRITAQLYRAGDRSSVWAETYERNSDDLVAAQIDVASRIARSLSPQLPN
jgi:TolB-like protein/DNA-binding winged helix-turn-helix (wHTH) protein